MIYAGLWGVIVTFCLFFTARFSFSAKLGRIPDIFEIPVFISLTSLGLIAPFGLTPYYDLKYLSPRLMSVTEISQALL